MTERLLSNDALAITLLCAHLGSPKSSGLAPLSDSEWDSLAERVARSPLKAPSGLFGRNAQQIEEDLGIDQRLADRIARLLARSGQMAFEIERLTSLGIWILTRADPQYPRQLRRRLRLRAPALFFGMGDRNALTSLGVAVVGSRELDDHSLLFATNLGRAAAIARQTVYSGGSRGADATAMRAAVGAGGRAVGILADSLERSLREEESREHLAAGSLCLISPFHPNMHFTAGNAMSRNKIIYCLASFAIVVASNDGKGGTWAGATEALKHKWVPVFTPAGNNVPVGNQRLVELGARPIPADRQSDPESLATWIQLVSREIAGTQGTIPTGPQPMFDLVWPLLNDFLETPRTEDDIASRFHLLSQQVSAWLTLAESRGLAHRSPNGWVTGSGTNAGQGSLFNEL